eukprot:scaffold93420_cov59-Phaeocystis_antarctica.AAC.5
MRPVHSEDHRRGSARRLARPLLRHEPHAGLRARRKPHKVLVAPDGALSSRDGLDAALFRGWHRPEVAHDLLQERRAAAYDEAVALSQLPVAQRRVPADADAGHQRILGRRVRARPIVAGAAARKVDHVALPRDGLADVGCRTVSGLPGAHLALTLCTPHRVLLRRRLPLRRPRDAQRRLLSDSEHALVHVLATTPHPRLVGLRLAGAVEVHAVVTRRVVGHEQRQPLRLRLLPRLLARQRHRRRCSLLRRRLPLRRPCDAQRRLLGGGEAAQVHHLATALYLRLVGLGLARIVKVHAEVTRRVVGHEQRQPLRLRLLPRLLARQRHRRRCSLLRRFLPLRRPRDAQRRLLGGGEAAQAHLLATARHPRQVGLGIAGNGVHAEVARLVLSHEQRQPLCLRLLPCLLARQRCRRCCLLRRLPPLRRPRNAQRRLLGGGEASQAHCLVPAPHLRLVGLGPAGLVVHAEVARLVVGHEQRQPLRLRLRAPHRRSPRERAILGFNARAAWRQGDNFLDRRVDEDGGGVALRPVDGSRVGRLQLRVVPACYGALAVEHQVQVHGGGGRKRDVCEYCDAVLVRGQRDIPGEERIVLTARVVQRGSSGTARFYFFEILEIVQVFGRENCHHGIRHRLLVPTKQQHAGLLVKRNSGLDVHAHTDLWVLGLNPVDA